jgi:oligopeptide/dipeptide ABC transporter ATP-binding protein
MYLGKIVEIGANAQVYDDPLHPYTKALLSAVPSIDPHNVGGAKRIILEGDVPSPINPPSGCRFHTRCPYAFDACTQVEPQLLDVGGEHFVACHLYNPVHADGAPEHAAPLKLRARPSAGTEAEPV